MNREALFSDGTEYFRCPSEPKVGEAVTIRIRGDHNDPLEVHLCTNESRYPMGYVETRGMFSYYQVKISLKDTPITYYFEVRCGNEICYYDRFGVSEDIRMQYAFHIVPGFSTPDWAKGAVMYQILVDRFCDGNDDNDVVDHEYHYITMPVRKIEDWSQYPAEFDVASFYGGDLQGVESKLDYLQGLGVEVIYFNPLFVSPSNHKYDIQDYDYIDPHYGCVVEDGGDILPEGDYDNRHATKYIKRVTDKKNLEASNKYFAQLVEKIHARGMKVILDGVFNHCGSFNKWLDRERIYENQPGYEDGAYISETSPYHDFFYFYENESEKWPYNYTYDGWWGHDTLPKLNYEGSNDLTEYILNIGRKWVSPPYNVDGWRLDVAADLGHSEEFNHEFWRKFRNAVKDANPNAVILAEHYGDATSWLQGDQWDTIMNYDAFMEPISFFLTGMEKHSDRFEDHAMGDGKRFEMTMLHCMAQFMTPSLYCAMNQLDNHDHSRFLTRTNHKVGRVAQLGSKAAEEDINVSVLKLASLMQMTWPGAPTLYYGDEAGVVGFTDPDNRRTYPWDTADRVLIGYHRDVIQLHKNNQCLKTGSFIFLSTGRDFVSYGRFLPEEKILVAVNSGGNLMEVDIPVWKLDVPSSAEMEQIFMTNELGYSLFPLRHCVEGGYVHLKLLPYSALVLRYKNN
ncbi:MAG: glycoside hydrolase family 13 protein [Lachnospiraceae bacterium]|nr:glycoside hydrolase family 13 protein [Lachnospiraceae bacterium]